MLNSPSACKHGHPCEPSGLKEAFSCALQHDPLDGSLIERVAAALGIKPGTLRDGTNPNEPDWLAPKHYDVVAAMTASHPVIARHFAKLQGGFFYKVPSASMDASTASSVVEFGEFLQSLPAGGAITPEAAARVRKEGSEAMAAIKAVMDYVEQRAVTR